VLDVTDKGLYYLHPFNGIQHIDPLLSSILFEFGHTNDKKELLIQTYESTLEKDDDDEPWDVE